MSYEILERASELIGSMQNLVADEMILHFGNHFHATLVDISVDKGSQ